MMMPLRRARTSGAIDNRVYPGIGSISSLVTWAAVSDLPLADNNAITGITARGGTAGNWTSYTANPTFKANIINGNPVARFTVGNMAFSFASSVNIQTFFLVGNNPGTDYAFTIGNSPFWHADPTYWASSAFANSNWYNAAVYRNGASQGQAKVVTRAGVTTNYIWSFELVGQIAATYFGLGNQSGRNYSGDVAEFIAFSAALSNTDWNAVLSYLGNKYNYSVTFK